jgi:PKD repeat protein
MALRNADLAILSARFGVARFGASRFGFCPDHVEGTGHDEPGEYVWKEEKPPTTLWTLQSLYSFCGERPVASFTDLPDPTKEDYEEVQFTDTSTPEELISYWYWDFGDGNASYEQNPTHIYADAGVYDVTLYVAGPRGSASVTNPHTVTTVVGPTCSFTNEEAVAFVVEFEDTSTPGTGAIVAWAWDFGDGIGTSTEQDPTYDYNGQSDVWDVVLVVTDEYGLTDDYTRQVGT